MSDAGDSYDDTEESQMGEEQQQEYAAGEEDTARDQAQLEHSHAEDDNDAADHYDTGIHAADLQSEGDESTQEHTAGQDGADNAAAMYADEIAAEEQKEADDYEAVRDALNGDGADDADDSFDSNDDSQLHSHDDVDASENASPRHYDDGEQKEAADDDSEINPNSFEAEYEEYKRQVAEETAKQREEESTAAAGRRDILGDEAYDDESDDDDSEGSGLESDVASEYNFDDANSDEDDIRTWEDVKRAKEERDHLMEQNKLKQRTIAGILERERNSRMRAGQQLNEAEKLANGESVQNPDQIRGEYIKTLDQLNSLWDELERKRELAEEKIDRLTAKLDRQDARATELGDQFKQFKREIAREARHSRTGKPIKLKRILAFEAAEENRDREVAEVRLKHINLLNELKQLEDQVKQKEKLAEGLHLIDFEQLKIENQTLNEKIEERNDELHKLRKKTTTTVQVLTHIKEKLQFVQEENSVLDAELAVYNEQVTQLRDQLTKMKHVRDQLRTENAMLKQKQGFIGSDLLVQDFEQRKTDLESMNAKVDSLRARWSSLNELTKRAKEVEKQQRLAAKTLKKGINSSTHQTFGSSAFAPRR